MKRIVASALAAFLLAVSPAQGFTTQKRYDEYLASLPAEGPQPSAEYVQEAVIAFMGKYLKDPESARYEWGETERGNFKGFAERFGTPGWIVSVSVNSKNSYGGYVGARPFKFVFRSGSIVEVYRFDERGRTWLGMIGAKGAVIPPLPSYDAQQPGR